MLQQHLQARALLIFLLSPCLKSATSTLSSGLSCNNDLLYADPVYNLPCSFYEGMACSGLTAIGFSDMQAKDFTEKCPETCGLCVKDISKKCGDDDESYRDKFQNGCKAYLGIKCTEIAAIMGLDENEVKELLSRCPATCDQCFEDINTVDFSTTVSGSSPTFEISSFPSHAPSSIVPNCFDDPAFRTIEYKLTCEMFSGAQSCDDLGALGLDKKEIARVK